MIHTKSEHRPAVNSQVIIESSDTADLMTSQEQSSHLSHALQPATSKGHGEPETQLGESFV